VVIDHLLALHRQGTIRVSVSGQSRGDARFAPGLRPPRGCPHLLALHRQGTIRVSVSGQSRGGARFAASLQSTEK
jgi:hypothetical protein